jgi:hypothetical protein
VFTESLATELEATAVYLRELALEFTSEQSAAGPIAAKIITDYVNRTGNSLLGRIVNQAALADAHQAAVDGSVISDEP